MLRYENFCTTGISVDLMNGFTVVALAKYINLTDKYNVTFYLTRDRDDFLDSFKEDVEFDSTQREIRNDITKYITEQFVGDKIKKYTKRYEYQMKCFDIGNDVLENEGDANV